MTDKERLDSELIARRHAVAPHDLHRIGKVAAVDAETRAAQALAGLREAIAKAEGFLGHLSADEVHEAVLVARGFKRATDNTEVEFRKRAARAEAEALFEKQAANEKLVRLLKAENSKAEAIAAGLARAAEAVEVQAVLEAQRQRDEAVIWSAVRAGTLTRERALAKIAELKRG